MVECKQPFQAHRANLRALTAQSVNGATVSLRVHGECPSYDSTTTLALTLLTACLPATIGSCF